MKKSKLIDILSTLSKDEIKDFEKLVASPYFSRGRDLVPFFKILKSFYPEFNSPNYTNEHIYKKLHPDIIYNKPKADNLIRVLSSDLFKLTDDFFANERFKYRRLLKKTFILEYYVVKKLNNMFEDFYSKTDEEFSYLKGDLNSDRLLDLFHFKKLMISYELHNDLSETPVNERDIFFLCVLFLNGSTLIRNSDNSRTNTFKKSETNILRSYFLNFNYQEFLSELNKTTDINPELRALFELCIYRMIVAIKDNQPEYFSKMEAAFYNCKHLLSDFQKSGIYSFLHTEYLSRNDKEKIYLMFQNVLKDNIFKKQQEREISYLIYRSILNNLLDLNKTDEAEAFIEKYSEILNEKVKDSMKNYSYALLEYHKNNFTIALEFSSKIDITHFVMKIDIRNLLLRIYYELEYFEEARMLCESYYKFLKSNKNVPLNMKDQIINFLNAYKELINLKLLPDKTNLKLLLKKVTEQYKIWHKNFLIEKINSLLK